MENVNLYIINKTSLMDKFNAVAEVLQFLSDKILKIESE